MRRAKSGCGGKVVHRLRHDPRPIDGVDPGQPHLVAEGVMVEQALHDRLAIVERALDGDGMDVIRGGCGHHPPLHVGDPAVWEHHEQIGARASAKRFDRGAAGVTRGRDRDGGTLAARSERMVHQPRQQLHGDVLERQRRPMEQFEQKARRSELGQRHDSGMAEGAVGLARHARQLGVGNAVADKKPDHLDRHFGVGPSGEARHRVGRQPRPSLRHIEPTVAGKARECDIDEAERRSFAAGGNVMHEPFLERRTGH